MKKSGKIQSCFIIAPPGVDTAPLKKVLSLRGVRWKDQSRLDLRDVPHEAIEKAIGNSDYAFAVLSTGELTNVLFEMGIAYAKGKPTFIFVDPDRSLPPDLSSFPYARTALNDSAALQFHVDAFLKQARKTRRKRGSEEPPAPDRGSQKLPEPPDVPITGQAAGLERAVADLFESRGTVVAFAPQKSQAIDMTVWLDKVHNVIGNPIPIEVKYGSLSETRLAMAESQLRDYLLMGNTSSAVGILVYQDNKQRRFPQRNLAWPLIVRFEFHEFAQLVRRGVLEERLLALRNSAVHGKTQ